MARRRRKARPDCLGIVDPDWVGMIRYQPWLDPDRVGAPAAAGPPPCFYWRRCRNPAEIEKGGKAVCRACAGRLRGREYPLRSPSREPLYRTSYDAAAALGMLESRRRKPAAGGID